MKEVERATGIEPVSEAWEASVLPLYYARSVSLREPSLYQKQITASTSARRTSARRTSHVSSSHSDRRDDLLLAAGSNAPNFDGVVAVS